MGTTIWVHIRKGDKRLCNYEDHSVVFELTEMLDDIAENLGVRPLSDFYDDTDIRYNLDESGEFKESEEGWNNDAANWFQPDEALSSLEAIRNQLVEKPETSILEHNSFDNVLEELEDLIAEVRKAKNGGNSFHFCVVM